MIRNSQIRLGKSEALAGGSLADAVAKASGGKVLRWYVAQSTAEELLVEVTTWDEIRERPKDAATDRFHPGRNVVLNVVPTGIGCSIGGFAGDAAPVSNLLAGAADYLIANPNTVNASNFINLQSRNILYTDGYSIDLFCAGAAELHIPYANRIGLIVENTDERSVATIYNIVNAVRAIHGVNISDVVVTEQRIGGRCHENGSKGFVGTVDNPQVLFDACERLISRGVNAIAITTNISDLPLHNYAKHFDGQYPNPIGGVEAIISYLVTNRFRLPSAHAPLLNAKELDLAHAVVDARGAGEFASESGLACVLIGLKNAPQIAPPNGSRIADVVNVHNLAAVVMPASCLGGVPAVYAQARGIPVIAVRENQTILRVDREVMRMDEVIEVENYAEAAGVLLALRNGIHLESVRRPLRTLRY
ncbi:DUF3326 domain-containing protein [Lysobacter enzymogenes]|uniref:DUF3326 domain-containing protein n=1 Tax=Lysobacter enzymogenes TaxID=69 RepID=UPI0018E92A68|nr:DUF3326 domain-containing protein [Lysobacter enzymogenes]UZW58373.1 DUF3326 domain-containing protein [Lysobacter enzymogenes]